MTAPQCPKCGKTMIDVCPECGEPVAVYSRPCGYLRPIETWNDGKRQEFRDRTEYAIDRKESQLKGDHSDER